MLVAAIILGAIVAWHYLRGTSATHRRAAEPDYVTCLRCEFEQWSGYKECQKCGAVFDRGKA